MATASLRKIGLNWNLPRIGLNDIDAEITGFPTSGVTFDENT